MDATDIYEFEDVPPVDPEHLRSALLMVYGWADAGADDYEEAAHPETIDGDDLCGLLDRILRTCDVDRVTTVALFKRAIALSAFCAESDLPETLFDECFPGSELCMAAAKAPVLNVRGAEDSELSHSFDEKAMHEMLLAARN